MRKYIIQTYQGHAPTFNGRHNFTKSKAWLTMMEQSLIGKPPMTAQQLAWETGIRYTTIGTLIPKWCKWHYCEQIPNTFPMKVKLLARGREWCKRWYDLMPLDRITAELDAWHAIRPPFPTRKKYTIRED